LNVDVIMVIMTDFNILSIDKDFKISFQKK
jgi:hypothetical protein